MQPEINPAVGVSLADLIVSGGDDRLDLGTPGTNRYHVCPTDYHSVFNRASCTCSPFTQAGYESACRLYDRLDESVFDEVRADHTRQIKRLINYAGEDRFHVFYAPSGSDLCYYPLLFSTLIHPDRGIYNVVTCPEELGSGSNTAYAGKFYFDRNQQGRSVSRDSRISDRLMIENRSFAARSADGKIINHWQEILDIIHQKYLTHSVNANLVIGSKSGIENNITIASQTPEDVLWTIDLCQFRASRVLINGLIGMNCLVMLTGSKFYQSPPFCAVLLVPRTISSRFGPPAPDLVEPFAAIFSRFDVPEDFAELRAHLPDFRNYGLLLRWQAALAEMTAMADLDLHTVNDVIQRWNEFVVTQLGQADSFQLMPDHQITNKTIVSFRVKRGNGDFLSHDELSWLYNTICQRRDLDFGQYDRVLFGQPVRYGDKSFIRIALGSSDVRRFVESGTDFENDRKLIQLIESVIEATRRCN